MCAHEQMLWSSLMGSSANPGLGVRSLLEALFTENTATTRLLKWRLSVFNGGCVGGGGVCISAASCKNLKYNLEENEGVDMIWIFEVESCLPIK